MVIRSLKQKIFTGYRSVVAILFLGVVGFLVYLSLEHIVLPGALIPNIHPLNNLVTYSIADGRSGSVSLPAKFAELAPRTKVTLSTDVIALPGESLLIKTAFTPFRLFVNDVLYYESGQPGTYAAFLHDPPTMVTTVPLMVTQASVQHLRFEYESPTQRSVLKIPAVMIGNESALLTYMIRNNWWSLLIGLFFIAIGLVIACSLFWAVPKGWSFLWLGLFSLAAGVWFVGECDLTLFVIPHPSLLYVMAYGGLFSLAIPFLQFGLSVVRPQNRIPLQIMLQVHYIALIGAFLLQICHIVDFSRSLYVFHVLTPLAFSFFAACLVWEYVRYRKADMKYFIVLVWVFIAFILLELGNYWLNLTFALTYFFQLGLFVFMVALAIVGGHYIRDSIRAMTDKTRLEYEVEVMQLQVLHQQNQYELLKDNIDAAREARHDLRHHLSLLRQFISENKLPELIAYVDKYSGSLQLDHELLICNNYAVNSIVNHYIILAKKQGIAVEYDLAMDKVATLSDIDLCVIFGNCLENAIAAAARVIEGQRFIKVRTKLVGRQLFIAIDNSFDGVILKNGDNFISRKHGEVRDGIGLLSVKAVVQRANGQIRLEYTADKFMVSIALPI